ncbi:hypothetical protein OG233_27630 [Streptomyces sp. NBC_01218]|uniref:hypothetical protein n=1 Tax=Streptomyces sp. NBC_01218 TaxID=2903780 RepID=UPI002E13DEE5|nr:hypothetical protein OG233_27630 [Streptomyces sp. NBC_01218]
MSGSPKYSAVTVAPAYARIEAERRRAREAARRRREAERAAERDRRAAERAREVAARRELARAEAERRRARLDHQREEHRRSHAAMVRQEQAEADVRGLTEVRELLGRVRAEVPEVRELRQRLDLLLDRAGRTEDLGGAIEELRGRVVLLGRGEDSGVRSDGHGAVLAGLEERLARLGREAREQDPQGHRRCRDLLDELRASAGPGAETRFQALLGTAEHALVRFATTAADRAAEGRREAARAREARRLEEVRAAEEEAVRQAALDAGQERLSAELSEVRDRLGVVAGAVGEAAAEARALDGAELAERMEAALNAVTTPLAAGAVAEALTAVAALEDLLAGTEVLLDEMHVADRRRMDLAQALQDAMIGEGFAFTGGEQRAGGLLLSFERPSGATYRTTITTEDGGAPVLVYQVDGEPDVTFPPDPESARCDRTEDLLERVHETIVEGRGFVPGELTWQGKPRRPDGRPQAAEDWTWTR